MWAGLSAARHPLQVVAFLDSAGGSLAAVVVVVHVPHTPVPVDPGSNDVDVSWVVAHHHPGVVLQAQVAHVFARDLLPLRITHDRVSLGGAQRGVPDRLVNVGALVSEAVHHPRPTFRVRVSFSAH